MHEPEHFMTLALAQAERGRGRTRPNPLVGAVVVKNGRVLATGYHARAGLAHAEVDALAKLPAGRARGADLYVTLEPCDHTGRTGPCSLAILEAGIARVFVGGRDPNPIVGGRGIRRLTRAGVRVETGVLGEACERLNEGFARHIRTGRPLVVAKLAESLDGRVATRTGESQWITGEEARAFGHRLRGLHDGIVVGVGTVLADDPRLTCRVRGGRDPIRIIVDSDGRTPLAAQVVRGLRRSKAPTWVVVGQGAPRSRIAALSRAGVEVITCRRRAGRVDLVALVDELGKRDVLSILVEGGPTVLGALFDHELVDKLHAFIAPTILGGAGALSSVLGRGVAQVKDAHRLTRVTSEQLGDDLLITGYLR